jgi:hypothetical protein
LRDEPFDATTTGQNKGVPVSTLSWQVFCYREHEIRRTQSELKACTPYFIPCSAFHKEIVIESSTPSTRKEHDELFL